MDYFAPIPWGSNISNEVITKTVEYTPSELFKIRVAGVILAMAVLLITYFLYKFVAARRANWEGQQELQERIDAGQADIYEEWKQVPVGIDKRLYLVLGLLICAAGAAMAVM
jgi:hypothetical protein